MREIFDLAYFWLNQLIRSNGLKRLNDLCGPATTKMLGLIRSEERFSGDPPLPVAWLTPATSHRVNFFKMQKMILLADDDPAVRRMLCRVLAEENYCVIAVEDVGYGNLDAPILTETLYQQHMRYPRPQHDRFLFAAHAIRVLASGQKDRTTDDMVNWAKHSVAFGERKAEIPDFALDMHTRRGAEMGRDYRWFIEEASRVMPEIPDKEPKYRTWILEALKAGKLS